MDALVDYGDSDSDESMPPGGSNGGAFDRPRTEPEEEGDVISVDASESDDDDGGASASNITATPSSTAAGAAPTRDLRSFFVSSVGASQREPRAPYAQTTRDRAVRTNPQAKKRPRLTQGSKTGAAKTITTEQRARELNEEGFHFKAFDEINVMCLDCRKVICNKKDTILKHISGKTHSSNVTQRESTDVSVMSKWAARAKTTKERRVDCLDAYYEANPRAMGASLHVDEKLFRCVVLC